MKVTVIGCWGGYPAPDGATSAYLLEKDGFRLMVDMGSGALAKIQTYVHVMDIDAVILSHYHHDHIADIGVLQFAWLVQSYLREQKEILPIYGHMEDETGFQSLTHDFTEGMAYDPSENLRVGPFTITFLKTVHPVPCYGMRITDGRHTIVYTADTSFQQEWIPFSRKADLLITDCNFYAEQDGTEAGHMNSEDAARIACEADVDTLLLSHLPQYGNIDKLVQEASRIFSGNIVLAREGYVWQG
ncbi:MAG TPA: MBL fold metallo-hydrolase [Bacillota bacterium]|nr:MBL fold metallo-hydrolase [Bacillota bacterium]